MYAFPQPQTRRRPPGLMRGHLRVHLRGRLRGLGMSPNQTGPNDRADYALWHPVSLPPSPPVRICPAWGCGPAAITGPYTQGPGPAQPAPIYLPPAPAPQTAGTPVPPAFSRNQIFVNSDGSQWVFSASQNKWIGAGTPYNVNAPGAPASTPASAATGYYTNTPVPLSWPTNQVFTDSTGNQWAYNLGYGTFQMTPSSLATAPLSSASVPAGTATNAPYTDASGNTWIYNPSTGAWALSTSAAASPYSSILNFLSQTSLGSAVGLAIPNWIVLAGLGFVALKFSNPSRGRR
jgi:hypothetical protein